MFNGQYKSINTVIENLLRDEEYYSEINQADATEWAVRAMELIGAPLVYEAVIAIVTFSDYRATLPTDVRHIIGVRDHTSRHTLIASDDEYLMALYNEQQSGYPDDDDSPIISSGELRLRDKGDYLFSYRIQNGYLFLNAKEGVIDIKYERFLTDDDGCIMIPDVDRYMMAVEAYIKYRIDHRLWRKGAVSKAVRDMSEQDWLWYVNSAFTKMVTPNYDEAESLKNQIQKIVVDKNAHDYGFANMNLPTRKTF